MKRLLPVVILVLIVIGCFAQTPGRPNFITFTKSSPTSGFIRWSAEPSANVGYYYIGLYPTTSMYYGPGYCDPFWNQGGGWATDFTQISPGIFNYDVYGLDAGTEYYAYIAAVETDGWSWNAYSSWEEQTLPVELSSFTAIATIQNYVELEWVTNSETGVNGYYVYRSNALDLSSAQIVSPLVTATNTSQEHIYNYTDDEITFGTWYYWLQNLDMNGSFRFYGPISVNLIQEEESETPGIPQVLSSLTVYPNPFNPNAIISINLEKKEMVNIDIYNVRGERVKKIASNEMDAGTHRLNWNGTDDNGRSLASGVYMIKMLSGATITTRNVVLKK